MENWVIVALVLGSNAIMGAVNWLMMKRQLEHSDGHLEKRMLAEKEARKHERQQTVRSEPLLQLRAELSHMVEKLEAMVDYAIQIIDGVSPFPDKTRVSLNKAVEGWNAYLESGEFYQALHMQYDHQLKLEANDIFRDYQSAYLDIMPFLEGGKGDEKNRAARDVIKEMLKGFPQFS